MTQHYAEFARFYDRIMGDRDEEIDRIQAYISKHLPAARSLLELGCGTGALLAGLASRLQVTGSAPGRRRCWRSPRRGCRGRGWCRPT